MFSSRIALENSVTNVINTIETALHDLQEQLDNLRADVELGQEEAIQMILDIKADLEDHKTKP